MIYYITFRIVAKWVIVYDCSGKQGLKGRLTELQRSPKVWIPAIWPSGKLPFECQKIAKIWLFFKNIAKMVFFFQKNCHWHFFKWKFLSNKKKKSSFGKFFDSQMAIFRRVSLQGSGRLVGLSAAEWSVYSHWMLLMTYVLVRVDIVLYHIIPPYNQVMSVWGFMSNGWLCLFLNVSLFTIKLFVS